MTCRRAVYGLAAVGLLAVMFAVCRDRNRTKRSTTPTENGAEAVDRSSQSAGTVPSATRRAPTLRGDKRLYAALDEQVQHIESAVVITALELARPWACVGESLRLHARVGGAPVDGMVNRWVWPTANGADVHPGQTVEWKAPPVAGNYEVRFQVCKDLGGKRVGILAEQSTTVHVRDCTPDQRQANAPLTIEVAQQGPTRFLFHSRYRGAGTITRHSWSFGDGETDTESGEHAVHAYKADALGPNHRRSFIVKLEVERSQGGRLRTSASAFVRGKPTSVAPRVAVVIEKPSYDDKAATWRAPLTLRVVKKGEITWELFERITKHFDGHVTIQTLDWKELVKIDKTLADGGFQGSVAVDKSAVPPTVKQIIDRLHGRTADGEEVTVSWTPFKRTDPTPKPDDTTQLPKK